MLHEGLLHRMQLAVPGQALDRDDAIAVAGDGQRQAGIHPHAVHQHGAGAALAVVAALLGAGQAEMVAQRIEQGRARIELEFLCLLIHREATRALSGGAGRLSGAAASCCGV